MGRVELPTPCLQGRCNNHYATSAIILETKNLSFFLLEVGFEPTHPEIIELKSTALDHSATQAILLNLSKTTAVGFEPTRVKPI